MGFGLILKRKREDCKLSQEEVAKRMGVSQKTISAWETERNVPKLDDYARMADIYGCTIHELSGQKSNISAITVQDIIIRLPDLAIEELEEIRDHIEKNIEIKARVMELEQKEREMQKKIQEYQREIERLKGGDANA